MAGLAEVWHHQSRQELSADREMQTRGRKRQSLIFKSRSQMRSHAQVQALGNKPRLFPKQSSRRLTTT